MRQSTVKCVIKWNNKTWQDYKRVKQTLEFFFNWCETIQIHVQFTQLHTIFSILHAIHVMFSHFVFVVADKSFMFIWNRSFYPGQFVFPLLGMWYSLQSCSFIYLIIILINVPTRLFESFKGRIPHGILWASKHKFKEK